MVEAWSALTEGDKGSYQPSCQTTLAVAVHTVKTFNMNLTCISAYQLGRYEPSSLSTKALHG